VKLLVALLFLAVGLGVYESRRDRPIRPILVVAVCAVAAVGFMSRSIV
jgi:hypothetical protein